MRCLKRQSKSRFIAISSSWDDLRLLRHLDDSKNAFPSPFDSTGTVRDFSLSGPGNPLRSPGESRMGLRCPERITSV